MGIEGSYRFPRLITSIRYHLARKKRKERREYKRVYDMHEDDLTWTGYQAGSGGVSYELSGH